MQAVCDVAVSAIDALQAYDKPRVSPHGASQYKTSLSLKERQEEAKRIRTKYPERVPVIVEQSRGSSLQELGNKKYMVPHDITVGQFIYVIRKRIRLSADKSMFVFVRDVLPPTAALMSSVYDEFRDADGFLYVTYSEESTFGCGDVAPRRCAVALTRELRTEKEN